MREMAQIEKQYARDAAQFRRERGRFNQIEFEDWVREKRGDEDKLAKYFAGTEFEQKEEPRAGSSPASKIPSVNSQADFDKLPPGAQFYENGVLFVKE